jgi:hypothetical protein
LVELPWTQVNLDEAVISIKRAKDGKSGDHPLHGDDIRASRRLRREHPRSQSVFVNERGDAFSTDGFAALARRAGERQKCRSRSIRICCATPAAISLPMMGKDTKPLSA